MIVRPLVDCDVHNVVPSIETLLPYLSAGWRETLRTSGFQGPSFRTYPTGAPISRRHNCDPSQLSDLQRHLDETGAELAVLTCDYAIESLSDPDVAETLAAALNDWMTAEWLEKEPRLRASILVPIQEPGAAAREIERVGGRRGFVQVHMPIRSEQLYGNRVYHPVYEAALERDLAIAMHYGGGPDTPPTGSGWSSYYLEDYAGMAHVFQSQTMNLIAEGVFDRFPDLRIALLEGGWAWVPAWMWRMDKEWKGLRREIPWVRDAPSVYMRKHMRFSTQPIDPPTADEVQAIVGQMGSDEMLMYSSDYPHVHAHEPADRILSRLPEALRTRIYRDNARAFYRL